MDEREHVGNLNIVLTYIDKMLAAADRRYEERFRGQQQALEKYEESVKTRFINVNELRGALSDATSTYMPRIESEARFESIITKIETTSKEDSAARGAMNQRIESLARRLDIREGETIGSKETRGESRAAWTTALAVMTVLALVAGVLVGHFGFH